MKKLTKQGKGKKRSLSKSFALTSAIILSQSIAEKKRMNTYDRGDSND